MSGRHLNLFPEMNFFDMKISHIYQCFQKIFFRWDFLNFSLPLYTLLIIISPCRVLLKHLLKMGHHLSFLCTTWITWYNSSYAQWKNEIGFRSEIWKAIYNSFSNIRKNMVKFISSWNPAEITCFRKIFFFIIKDSNSKFKEESNGRFFLHALFQNSNFQTYMHDVFWILVTKKTHIDLRRILRRRFGKIKIQVKNVYGINSVPILDHLWLGFLCCSERTKRIFGWLCGMWNFGYVKNHGFCITYL